MTAGSCKTRRDGTWLIHIAHIASGVRFGGPGEPRVIPVEDIVHALIRVVDSKKHPELRNGMIRPESRRNLIVHEKGPGAYFTQPSHEMQDDVINGNELHL